MNPASTSDLWNAQEAVFTGQASPRSLWPFTALVLALRVQGPSNLTIRNDIATGDVERAYRDFQTLCGGYGPAIDIGLKPTDQTYYKEGFSYMLNVKTAVDWLNSKGTK